MHLGQLKSNRIRFKLLLCKVAWVCRRRLIEGKDRNVAFDLTPLALTAALGGFVDNKVEMGVGGMLVKRLCSEFLTAAPALILHHGVSDATRPELERSVFKLRRQSKGHCVKLSSYFFLNCHKSHHEGENSPNYVSKDDVWQCRDRMRRPVDFCWTATSFLPCWEF